MAGSPIPADINQRNPLYPVLIQHAVWTTENSNRWMARIPFYSDPEFLNKVNTTLYREFPAITVFGEAWVQSVTNSAYFCENNIALPFKHNSQGVTDFPLYFATNDLINQSYGWNEGANKFYQVLAQDILIKSMQIASSSTIMTGSLLFCVWEDIQKYKAVNLLLTMRGGLVILWNRNPDEEF
jgi:hypothetical protein